MSGRIPQAIITGLDKAAVLLGRKDDRPLTAQVGEKGEDAAYFYLRRLGYVIVARNFRSARRKGEVDLIGWDGDVLCFIEVKTRSSRGIAPAAHDVDFEKQRELRIMAREYRRMIKTEPRVRFDVVSVYLDRDAPEFGLMKSAFAAN